MSQDTNSKSPQKDYLPHFHSETKPQSDVPRCPNCGKKLTYEERKYGRYCSKCWNNMKKF